MFLFIYLFFNQMDRNQLKVDIIFANLHVSNLPSGKDGNFALAGSEDTCKKH